VFSDRADASHPQAGPEAASTDVRSLLQSQFGRRRRAPRARSPQLRLRVGREKNDHFACTPATLVLPDDKKACEYGLRGARFFASSMAEYYLSGTRPLGRLAVPRDFLPAAELEAAMAMRNAPGSQVTVIVGDPAA